MLVATSQRRLLQAAAVAPLVFFPLLSITAVSQSPKPAAPAATPAVALQPYTASDRSASAGVPSGWKVTSGAQTVIQMSSPQGVAVSLGSTVIARNAAFQLGQKPANGIDLSMPSTATLAQKLTMILQQGAASSGKPAPQVTIDSTTPLRSSSRQPPASAPASSPTSQASRVPSSSWPSSVPYRSTPAASTRTSCSPRRPPLPPQPRQPPDRKSVV